MLKSVHSYAAAYRTGYSKLGKNSIIYLNSVPPFPVPTPASYKCNILKASFWFIFIGSW